MTNTPVELIEAYLSLRIANLGYPVGMGVPVNPETARKMAEDCMKIAAPKHAALKAALEEIERRANDMGGQTPAQRCSVIAGIARRALTEG